MYEYCANRQYFVQSIIYIYIYCQYLSQNFSKMTGNRAKRDGLTEKRREAHGFTPFSLCFAPFSLDFTAKRSNFKRFHAVTEENRAFRRRFHRIRRRFRRVRSRFSCLFSGRENAQENRGVAFPSGKIPKPSPGVPLSTGSGGRATGFRRPAAGAAQDSHTKKFCEGVPFLLLRSPCVRSV